MACLRDLPLPEPDSGRSIGSRGSASSAGGWDENVGEARARFSFEQASADSRRSCSVATHAVAHGCKVLGVKPADRSGQYVENAVDNLEEGRWISWEATFEPHRVCRVASNPDGSVVVASTAGGTVSLLRGADGSVLATRRVYSTDDEETSSLPAEVNFVAGASLHQSATGDVLIILVPPREADMHCDKEGGATDEFGNPTHNADQPYINIILVSGIDGSRLNSPDPAVVASAARGMSIDVLELSLPSENDGHVASLNGCFVNDHIIRFLAADGAGSFSAHDYNVKTKRSEFVEARLLNESLCQREDRWAFDELVGIRVDDRSSQAMFALCASMNSSTKVCYYDVTNLKPQCDYTISGTSRKDRPKLFALEPVKGCGESTVAVAIAFKPSSSSADGSIQVAQAVIGTGDSRFHLICKVPVEPSIEQSIRWIDVAPLEQQAMNPYSFHYKVSYNSGVGECKQFDCTGGDTVGKFRALLAKGLFDDADALLATAGTSGVTSSPYASIHGSEVAVAFFRHILDDGSVSTAENMSQAKDCLRRLAAGAVSGGDVGVQCLLDASESLIGWPNGPSFRQSDESDKYGPRTQEFRMALTAMSASIGGAMKAVPPAHLPSLKAEKRKLDARASAMKCLELVLGIDKTDEVFLTPQLSAATSSADLFRSFVSQGAFVVAERVRLSEFGKNLTPAYMASSIVGVPSSIDPRSYIAWLRDIVIPGLTINHPLLLAIRSWACQTADAFDGDDNNLGIDASITLLKTVADATAKLSASVHSSFASSPPFGEDEIGGISGKAQTEEISTLSDSSFSSAGASVSNASLHGEDPSHPTFIKPPNPTVMKLGLLRGAPRLKGSKSFLARRVRQVGGSSGAARRMDVSVQNASVSDAETYKMYAEFMDKEDEDEYVETKLLQACSLKEARTLGLPKRAVSLGTYNDFGGSTFIAKELIRLSSATTFDDSERELKVMENVLPFCKQAGVDFGEVLSKHTKEICDHNRNNPKILLEAASLSRICSASTKCEVALKVLRAALLCNEQPPALSDLSKDAIEWAVDEGVRSELEEASRLLVVDRVVRRYCGNGAQELFRVSDPRHGLKLLQFVCRHIDEPSVLPDALALCDAFTHLFKSHACLLILKRMAMAPSTCQNSKGISRAEQCAALLRNVHSMDAALADSIGEQICTFCADTVEDCATMLHEGESSAHMRRKQRDAMAASAAAISLLAVLQETKSRHRRNHAKSSASMSKVGSSCSASLLREFQCIRELQTDFSIFITISDLRKRTSRDEVARLLLRPAVDFFETDNGAALDEQTKFKGLRSAVTHARRGLALLCVDNQVDAASYWCKAVGKHAVQLAMSSDDDSACMSFAHAAGLLDDLSSDSAFDAIYSIATAQCIRASKASCCVPLSNDDEFSTKAQLKSALFAMRCIIRASSLLQEHALRFCPQELLSPLVALTGLTDTVSQVLVRADGGSGEVIDAFRSELNERARERRDTSCERNVGTNKPKSRVKLPPSQPLHPSWYIGDGLLLSPLEALVHCMDYCKDFMCQSAFTSKHGIYSFLGSRGAYTIALRMRACATAVGMVSNQPTVDLSFDLDNSLSSPSHHEHEVRSLAERSLGGSGSGITSGTIDSQLALSYLLILPMKLAFKVYRASLPSAISRRDFPRVMILASIGVRAGDGGSVACWKKQEIFVSQCRRLAANARWWGVLQRFSVAFDPKRFEGSDKSQVDAYIASLVLPLIIGSSKALLRTSAPLHRVLELATKFVRAFGLDEKLAAQKHIEFLLSLPGRERKEKSATSNADIRHDLVVCENAAKETLLLLPSPMARAAILRRCLISLESSEDCFKEYDRYACVISLYLSELSLVLTDGSCKSDAAAFQEEYERIDKRQDAIAILSSFFQERTVQERPSFPSLFLPLPSPFKSDRGKPKRRFCGILGHESAGAAPDDFDPLLPLIPRLSADCGPSTAAALSPLCISLGLPSGYIHARSLYTRIMKAKSIGSALPAFETVRPVINRIKAPGDGAELAEWCAMQYIDGTKDRLQCLELALSLAFRASREAEERVQRNSQRKGQEICTENERRALETVKRLSDMKSALADRIRVEGMLGQGKTVSSSHADFILTELVEKVQSAYLKSSQLSPESFVEGLLVQGSMMTASASLDESVRFTTDDFRQVAVAVHQACKGLAEQYSHVDVGKTARVMARRWLVHGDEISSNERYDDVKKSASSSSSNSDPPKKDGPALTQEPATPQQSLVHSENDDDTTSEFVMDLNVLGSGGDVWSDDVGSRANESTKLDSVIADEEPSALSGNNSARERTEHANARVALRIAFVMSFADGYYSEGKTDDGRNNENVQVSHKAPQTSSKLNSSFSVRSRANESSKTCSTQGDRVIEHARELLGIAMAKSGGAAWKNDMGFESMMRDSSTSYILSERKEVSQNVSVFDGETSRNGAAHEGKIGKIHSFAMRHRALRAAAILCPQEALEMVVRDEGYFDNSGEQTINLGKCAFGSFLAMEIEAMGLPLPHSDLVQLSTMHFPSYARALWRHHGQNECRGYKGRLLVLLLELCLKDGSVTDSTLVLLILSELTNKALPRSLLTSCELIISNNAAKSILAADNGKDTLLNAVRKTAKLVLVELNKTDLNVDQSKAMTTIQRLGKIIVELHGTGVGKAQLSNFVEVMCDFAAACDNEVLLVNVLRVVAVAASCLDKRERIRAFSQIVQAGGRPVLEETYRPVDDDGCIDAPQEEKASTAATKTRMMEASFQNDLALAIQDECT